MKDKYEVLVSGDTVKYIKCTNNQALAASPSGVYLAAATAETITLYLVSTGAVVVVVTRHYQLMTVLRTTYRLSENIRAPLY